MDSSSNKKFRFSETKAGVLLVLLCVIALPFILHYFRGFYSGSWEDYKSYFPHFFFLFYPLVKILPFAIVAFVLWLLRKPLMQWKDFLKWLSSNGAGISLSFITATVALLGTELLLRKNGYRPGQLLAAVSFTPVDSLILLDGFETDSNGIFKVASNAGDFICNELIRKDCIYDLTPPSENQSKDIYSIPLHFIMLQGYHYKSDFKTFIHSLGSENDSLDIPFINAVKKYIQCPVNSDGFRSIEFKKYPVKRKSILLLGDSFTWGYSASNLTNSFADLLLAKGYIVYNTGMAGADPAQYLQLATTLIPQLQPDFVIVNFYLGNDVLYFERKINPHVPLFYCTNAGNLISCPDGIYFNSAQEAYDYSISNIYISANENRFNSFCAKTVLTTFFWKAVSRIKPDLKLTKYQSYRELAEMLRTEKPYSNNYLSKISKIAFDNSSHFVLIAIPMYDGNKFHMPNDFPSLFDGLKFYTPAVKNDHYDQRSNGHYNDLGHALHATFIDSLIKTFPDSHSFSVSE